MQLKSNSLSVASGSLTQQSREHAQQISILVTQMSEQIKHLLKEVEQFHFPQPPSMSNG